MSTPPNKCLAQAEEHAKLLQSLQSPKESVVSAWRYGAEPTGYILALWRSNCNVDEWRHTVTVFVSWAHAAGIAAWSDAFFVRIVRVSPADDKQFRDLNKDDTLLYLQWTSHSDRAQFIAALHEDPRLGGLFRPIISILSLGVLDMSYSDQSDADSQTSIVQV